MKKSTPVIEVEAEEIPLETVIDNQLVKANVTEQVIATLKEKYSGLKLNSATDKDGYLNIKECRKEVRSVGILTEKLCKKGRENAVKEQKLWLAKEAEILGKIAEVQDPLDAEIKKFEDELERQENEKKQRQEEAYIHRQAELSKMGAVYANGCFNLNDVVFESNLVKESDEDIWQNSILPKFRIEYEKNESVRVAEETKRKEEEAKLRQERDKLELEQKQFREQQEAFKKQQDEAELVRRQAAQKEQEEIAAKEREKLKVRGNQLAALGMTFNFQHDAYVFQDINVDNKTEICLLDDAAWNDLVNEIKPSIEERKEVAERIRLEKIEQDKKDAEEAAIKKERERIEEEQRLAEIKMQQEEALKIEQLNAASDKVKWETFVQSLQAIQHSEMKSPKYRKMQQIAKEKIEEVCSIK